MKIEIGKVEKVIKDNDKKFREILIETKSTFDGYDKVCRLFNCFLGDLYKLFGNEYIGKLIKEVK